MLNVDLCDSCKRFSNPHLINNYVGDNNMCMLVHLPSSSLAHRSVSNRDRPLLVTIPYRRYDLHSNDLYYNYSNSVLTGGSFHLKLLVKYPYWNLVGFKNEFSLLIVCESYIKNF